MPNGQGISRSEPCGRWERAHEQLQEQEEVCVPQIPRDDEQGDGDACDGKCRQGRVRLTRSSGRAYLVFACVTRGQRAGKCREVVRVAVNNQEKLSRSPRWPSLVPSKQSCLPYALRARMETDGARTFPEIFARSS